MVETILGLIVFTLGGGYITWRHGERKFKEGVVSALMDHHKGRLTYKAKEDGDHYFLEIHRIIKEE